MKIDINQHDVEIRDAEPAISELLIQIPPKQEVITPEVVDEETGEVTTPAVTKKTYPLENVRFRFRVKYLKDNNEAKAPNNIELVEGTIPDNNPLLVQLMDVALNYFKNRPEVTLKPE